MELFSPTVQCFPGQDVDVRYDFELFPNRKPKFLAQTAAHVSGGAFYYQQSNVEDHPWTKKVCHAFIKMLQIYSVCFLNSPSVFLLLQY